jgi:hypothetical protein
MRDGSGLNPGTMGFDTILEVRLMSQLIYSLGWTLQFIPAPYLYLEQLRRPRRPVRYLGKIKEDIYRESTDGRGFADGLSV